MFLGTGACFNKLFKGRLAKVMKKSGTTRVRRKARKTSDSQLVGTRRHPGRGAKRNVASSVAAKPSPLPPKITPPKPTNLFRRQRLFTLLDAAFRDHRVVWISAPAGSGKTSLAASYVAARKRPVLWYQLDAGDADAASFFHFLGLAAVRATPRRGRPLPALTTEYFGNLAAFARNYFRSLYARLPPDSIIVLDNYQDTPDDAPLHEALNVAMGEAPARLSLLVLSRAGPPAALARLWLSGYAAYLDGSAMQLTPEESAGIGALHGLDARSRNTLDALHARAHGWAAGLVLLLEGTRRGAVADVAGAPIGRKLLFDYFAGEIFARTDRRVQMFLLKTALFSKLSAAHARAATGLDDAQEILEDLVRRNYFTVRHAGAEPTYGYHTLFREFLLEQARRRLSGEAQRDAKRRAASLLIADGQSEDAVDLLRELGDWDGLSALIVQRAAALMAEGRSRTLESWLRALPAPVRDRSPWLLYWLGLCRLPFDPIEARHYLEAAYALFKNETGSHEGLLATWCAVVESFIYEWGDFHSVDGWIAELERLLAASPALPPGGLGARVASGMFMALMYRQPQHPALPMWAERVQTIVLRSSDARTQTLLGHQLVFYYATWLGDFASARLVRDAVRLPAHAADNEPLAYIAWRTAEANYHWFMAEHEACLRAVNDGLAVADRSGIRLLNALLLSQGVIGGLTGGDFALASRLLERGKDTLQHGRLLDRAHYSYLLFLDALFRKDALSALGHAREAVRLGDMAGVPFGQALYRMGLAHALYDSGERRAALLHLAQARRIGRRMRSANIEFGCLFSAVSFALARGKHRLAIPLLRKTLAMAKQRGYVNRPLWTPDIMSRLFIAALEHGIEVDYVRQLIRKRRLTPPDVAAIPEAWPWPVRIYTLGRFGVFVDEKPIQFTTKAQCKPLALLKALVARGGRDVRNDALAVELWPESAGDLAAQALDTTVHRLRKLLGEDAVLRRNGCTVLDARRVWVDAWMFERELAAAETACRANDAESAQAAYERMLCLYRGEFLPGDTDSPAALGVRERLRGKFLRHLDAIGQCLARAGRREAAIVCYQKGIELDPAAEAFYRGLLRCYLDLGRRAEARAVYQRCRDALARYLGVTPSAETEALHRAASSS